MKNTKPLTKEQIHQKLITKTFLEQNRDCFVQIKPTLETRAYLAQNPFVMDYVQIRPVAARKIEQTDMQAALVLQNMERLR